MASERTEASMFALSDQIRILRSIQRPAVGDLHPAGYCFRLARGDYETELEALLRRTAESHCSRRCCLQNPYHRLVEKGDDDTARVERPLPFLRQPRSFRLMYVLNRIHYHSPLR